MATVEPPERDVKDFEFIQLCKFRVDASDSHVPMHRSSLLACSSQYGLLIYGTKNGFSVVRSSDLTAADEEVGKERNKVTVNNFAIQATVELSSPVIFLEISSDGLTLAVVLKEVGQLQVVFYDIRVFADKSQDPMPFGQHLLGKNATSGVVSDIAWNPGVVSMLAICYSDGSLDLMEVVDNPKVIGSLSNAIGVTCLSWSPKGKQLLVGKKNGTFSQYDHALTEKKNWPSPSIFSNPQQAVDVYWMSTYTFMASYLPVGAQATDQPTVVLTSSNKENATTYINYDDICFGNGEDRKPHYFFHFVSKWEVMLMASSRATEATVVGKNLDDKVRWEHWNLEDCSRAELPLTADQNDSFPLGLAVDYSPCKDVITADGKTFPPCPMMFFLSTDGILLAYHIVYTHQAAESVIKPAQAFSAAGAKRNNSIGIGVPSIGKPGLLPTPSNSAVPSAPATSTIVPTPPKPVAAPVPSVVSSMGQSQTSSFSFPTASKTPAFQFGGFSSKGPEQPSGGSKPASGFPSLQTATTTTQSAFGGSSSVPFSFGGGSSTGSAFNFGGPPSTPSASEPAAPKPAFSGPFQAAPASGLPSNLPKPNIPQLQQIQPNKPSQVPIPAVSGSLAVPQKYLGTPGESILAKSGQVPQGPTSFGTAAWSPAPLSLPVQATGALVPKDVPPPAYQEAPRFARSAATTDKKESNKSISASMDNACGQNILEEIADFERELKELKIRCKRQLKAVGTKPEMVALRQDSEKMAAFSKELKEATKDQLREVQDQKSLCFNHLVMAEECRTLQQRNGDPHYHMTLQGRSLDPVSAEKLKNLQQLSQYLEETVVEMENIMDAQWNNFLKMKKQQEVLRTPTGDTIYRSIKNNHILIANQRKSLDKLEEQMKNLKLYAKTSAQDNIPINFLELNKLSPLRSSKALSGEMKPATLDSAVTSCMTPEKIAKLKEMLAQRKVPVVKSTTPASLSRSRIVANTPKRSPSTPGTQQGLHPQQQSFQTTPTGVPAGQLRLNKAIFQDSPKKSPGAPAAFSGTQSQMTLGQQASTRLPIFAQNNAQSQQFPATSFSGIGYFKQSPQASHGGQGQKTQQQMYQDVRQATQVLASHLGNAGMSQLNQLLSGSSKTQLNPNGYEDITPPETDETNDDTEYDEEDNGYEEEDEGEEEDEEATGYAVHIGGTTGHAGQGSSGPSAFGMLGGGDGTLAAATNAASRKPGDLGSTQVFNPVKPTTSSAAFGSSAQQSTSKDLFGAKAVSATSPAFGTSGAPVQAGAAKGFLKPSSFFGTDAKSETGPGQGESSVTSQVSGFGFGSSGASTFAFGAAAPSAVSSGSSGASTTTTTASLFGQKSELSKGTSGFSFGGSSLISQKPNLASTGNSWNAGSSGPVFGALATPSKSVGFADVAKSTNEKEASAAVTSTTGTTVSVSGVAAKASSQPPAFGSGGPGKPAAESKLTFGTSGAGAGNEASGSLSFGQTSSSPFAVPTVVSSSGAPDPKPTGSQGSTFGGNTLAASAANNLSFGKATDSAANSPSVPVTSTESVSPLTTMAATSNAAAVSSASSPVPASATTSVAAQSPAPTSSTASPFSVPSSTPATVPIFGSSTTPTASFGESATASSTSAFGGVAKSPFGAPASTQASQSIFGGGSKSLFGSASKSLFGSVTTASLSGSSGVATTSSEAVSSIVASSSSATSAPSQISTITAASTASPLPGDKTTSSASLFSSPGTVASAGTTPPLFGSGSPTTATTATTTKPSLFGGNSSSVSSTSVFGGSAVSSAPSSPFGGNATSTSTSLFGGNVTSTSTSLFGGNAVSSPSSLFGGNNVSSASPSVFGGSNATSASTSVFGNNVASTSASGFGSSAAPSTSAPVFGGGQSTAPLFGTAATTTSGSSFFGFGSTNTATSSASSSGSLFGTTSASTSASTFGTSGGSLFGGQSPATSTSAGGSLFGGANTSSPFGSAKTSDQGSLFSQTPSTASSGFGQPAGFGQSSSGSLFGSDGGFGGLGGKPSEEKAKQNVFGSTQVFGDGGSTFQSNSLFGSGGSSSFGNVGTTSSTPSPGGVFSAGSGGVASTGFGVSATQSSSSGFGAPASFGNTPSFGSGATFGSAKPAFGTSPAFGGSATFGSSAFPSPTSSASTFGSAAGNTGGFSSFASAPAPSFGQLAQTPPSSGFGGMSGGGFGNDTSSPFGGSGTGTAGAGGFGSFGSAPAFGQGAASPGFGSNQNQGFGNNSSFGPSFSSYRG